MLPLKLAVIPSIFTFKVNYPFPQRPLLSASSPVTDLWLAACVLKAASAFRTLADAALTDGKQ